MTWHVLSAVPGIAWPALPSLEGAATLALLHQLEQTQWLPPERLVALQMRQLEQLLRHVHAEVPFYRRHWGSAFDPSAAATPERLAALPLLTRRDLLENYGELKSRSVPPEHGDSVELRTSGSTGSPVRVLKTQLSQLFWNALTLRDHRWHGRDLRGKLVVVRHGVKEGPAQSWGPATAGLLATGQAANLNAATDIGAQLDWLRRERPDYLLTYPSNAAELARLSLARGERLSGLREVRTLGEMLADDAREACRAAWGVPLVDMYSANEVGYVALQCPQHQHYHVQSESVLVEVIDERGQPVAPGGMGRLVVTDLQNFGTPLVRYEIGDYAEAGGPCRCGRGLPVLSRIAGRVRNLLVTADGKRYWPLLGSRKFIEVAPVLQHQVVQKQVDRLEVRLVTAQPIDASQEARLREMILAAMPAGMQLEFVYLESIPRGRGGKFEDFVSEVASGGAR